MINSDLYDGEDNLLGSAGNCNVTQGRSYLLKAESATGYVFKEWLLTGDAVLVEASGLNLTEYPKFILVNGFASATAVFEQTTTCS